MFIIQLCLTVIPLLYITTANANIFIGHAVEDFSVDSNATIMAFGNPQGACKFMFLDPKSNTTCCYSNNAQDLCYTDKQSSSCRSSETAVVTAPTGRCQLLLIRVQESGSRNIWHHIPKPPQRQCKGNSNQCHQLSKGIPSPSSGRRWSRRRRNMDLIVRRGWVDYFGLYYRIHSCQTL